MIVFCVFLVLCCNLVQGRFPRACTTEAAFRTKTCCPLWTDRSPCGSTSGRGQCRDWVAFTTFEAGQERQYDDDRLGWPSYYYNRSCECFGNYSGFDCGGCKPGYVGDKCDRKVIVERKDIRELSLVERKRFFSYLAMAKTTISKNFVILTTGDRHHRDTYRFVNATIYDIFSWIHYYSTKPILMNGTFNSSTNYAHEGPAFLPWHRVGLLFLERDIQLMTGDQDFAIPYYDWRGERNCSICTDDFLGDNDVQGFLSEYSHFAFWKTICSGYSYDEAYCLGAHDQNQMQKLYRKPGADPEAPSLPTFLDVENVLKLKDYDRPPHNTLARGSFRNVLEGFMSPADGVTLQRSLHNLVHVYFGGTMAEVPISSNDPMFLLHHCFIDKIYEVWIRRYNATPDNYPENIILGQGPNECSTPYFPCYRNKDFLSPSTNFGYTFSIYQGL